MKSILLGSILLPKDTHMTGGGLDQRLWGARKQDLAPVNDHKLPTHGLYVLDNVGGQQHQPVLGGLGKEIAEMNTLFWIQAHCGLVQNQQDVYKRQ